MPRQQGGNRVERLLGKPWHWHADRQYALMQSPAAGNAYFGGQNARRLAGSTAAQACRDQASWN